MAGVTEDEAHKRTLAAYDDGHAAGYRKGMQDCVEIIETTAKAKFREFQQVLDYTRALVGESDDVGDD